LKVVFADPQLQHNPHTFYSSGTKRPHPEKPERASRLLAAAEAAGLERQTPGELGEAPAKRLHTARYLDYLQTIYSRWTQIDNSAEEVVPGIGPDARSGDYPASATGQAGVHNRDLSCPINADTWTSVLWSAHTAAQAAANVLAGDTASYALCRPPGHHATRDYAAGFCYLGNTAIAVETLRERYDRVAVLDVDVHHGNGTQYLFYTRADVLTVSIHADPAGFFPFHWGYAHETGEAEGENKFGTPTISFCGCPRNFGPNLVGVPELPTWWVSQNCQNCLVGVPELGSRNWGNAVVMGTNNEGKKAS